MLLLKSLSLLLVPLVFLLIILSIDDFVYPIGLHGYKWAITLFFFFLSLAIKLFLDFVYFFQPDKFAFYFMATSTLRMIASSIFFGLLIWLGINREDLISFVITFLIHYFLYLFFEIYFLLVKLQAKS